MPVSDEQVRQLVGQACAYLDAEDFDGFLGLCAREFRYQITVYSPEISKKMIWLNHDLKGLEALFAVLPEHVRLLGTLFRHVSVYRIAWEDSKRASVTSSFLVVHTDPDGQSRLFAAGRYHDTVLVSGDVPRLLSRTVQLETRDIGEGSQVPL